jgi:hypothetical protein
LLGMTIVGTFFIGLLEITGTVGYCR